MPSSHDPLHVEYLISKERFGSYLNATLSNREQAVALYEWNAALAAACFQAFHYVEVIVRNAMDREMRAYFGEAKRLIPWFLLPVVDKHQVAFFESIEKVRRRLRDQSQERETRDQIIAGVDFSFWTTLLHKENEELWRHALCKAFPYSSGKRADVVAVLETLRIFRNRLAHHDSLLGEDVPFRLDQMRQVLRWVDPEAEKWLVSVERISTVYASRPSRRLDTVIVAAKNAWPLYQELGAYVCQAGRSFRSVKYLAFYADREIKQEVPMVRRRRDNVDWAEAEVKRLLASGGTNNHRLARIITESRARGWTGGRYQVFELTNPGEAEHLTLPGPIPHLARGKGSAFTQGQRYTQHDALIRASSTQELQ